MPGRSHQAWPEAETYRHLASAGRAQLAWEWLRRDTNYRQLQPSPSRKTRQGVTIIEAAPVALRKRWGCLVVGDATRSVPAHPILWDASLDASALRLEARRRIANDKEAFDIRNWTSHAVIVTENDRSEHLLLHRGGRRMHLHIVAGTLLEGPVALQLSICGSADFEPAMVALKRFMYLHHRGEWLPERALSDRVSRRTQAALRVHDAMAAGASIRDIGIMLFGEARVEAQWRDPGESLKSQCRRLIALARGMAGGGYKDLLR